MNKPKKITIKFYLNKQLQAGTIHTAGSKIIKKAYPLYIMVTYNRKNTQLKSMYGMIYSSLQDVQDTEKGLIEFEEKTLRKIIEYEVSHLKEGEEYDLKGLKEKYKIYATSIHIALEQYLKPKLRLAILKTNDELQHALNLDTDYYYNTVLRLYAASQKLFENFNRHLSNKELEELKAYQKYHQFTNPVFNYNFPTVISWMDGTYKKELESTLKTMYKNKPETVKQIIALIQSAVNEKQKQLNEIS